MALFDRHLPPQTPAPANPIPSSSPAFAAPLHPIRFNSNTTTASAFTAPTTKPSTILPILLPPPSLRPIAFRTFTKKHNLTLTSTALQALASFIGKNCGSEWRGEGLAELVLEEVAKTWKRSSTDVIVDGTSSQLKMILKTLEACMVGGRIAQGKSALSRQSSFAFETPGQASSDKRPRLESQDSFGLSSLEMDTGEEDEDGSKDLRSWLKVVGAFEQPRLEYNAEKRHIEKSTSIPSFFPPPSRKTELFRQRYHLIYQRLLRNESFQAPSLARQNSASQQQFKVTTIANLLGRSGTGHLILGMFTVSPAGTLAINDLSGSIALDLEQATPIDQQESWLTPGMIVLVDGVYEEEYGAGTSLGSLGGIGGTIGGRFVGFQVGAPKCEPRATTLGNTEGDVNTASGFGWVDFLGLGSERAIGPRMQRMEKRLLARHQDSGKMIMIGEVNLDNPRTLDALKKIFATYATDSPSDIPMSFILMGNFVRFAAMAGGASGGSIEYKEYFDTLAALLSDFPVLLRSSTFVFVPGDNDPWPSAFSAGAATPLPRKEVPAMFTSRIRRAFATVNSEIRNSSKTPGEAVWTSNPSRLSLCGPAHELVIFRDDVSSRLRRNAIGLKSTPLDHLHTDRNTEAIEMSGALARNTQNTSAQSSASHDDQPTPMDLETDLRTEETLTKAPENALPTPIAAARRLTKTLLDQSHLSPFPLSMRPLHWDYAHALSLYPLPATLVLCDAEALPFVCTYQGCHVVNVGACVGEVAQGKKGGRAVWVEYDVATRRGTLRECWL